MGDKTEISWTDHTFNPWWGCTKIAPGCDNCYAAALDHRTGGKFWDVKKNPRRTKKPNWDKVLRWQVAARDAGVRHKVFCGSMMDWCDKNAPDGARELLFELIKATPNLDWQLLTKRATLIERCLPEDWGDGYDNVWLGVTVEDKKFGYRRIEELQKIPAKVRFISAEPLLENLDGIESKLDGIDWVIIGGESGINCRKMHAEWAEDLFLICEILKIPVWFKQWGGNSKDKGGDEILGIINKEWPANERR